MGQVDEALETYMSVVYEYLSARRDGEQIDPFWFTRAAFSAAGMMEAQERWRDALRIYRRVEEARIPAAEEARKRIQKIRLEQLIAF